VFFILSIVNMFSILVSVFLYSLDSFDGFQINSVAVDQLAQCRARFEFDHDVCEITVVIDSLNFHDFFAFV
jgi:hypothetical protein